MAARWRDLGGGSFVMRSAGALGDGVLLNTGLVVGAERALVIDTGCGPRHGAEILAAVRTVTALPLVVVNTHAHWDHFFGNATFRRDGATDFWAHVAAARGMAASGERARAEVAQTEPEMAAGAGVNTDLVPPTHVVDRDAVTLDLGGTSAELFTLGRGHTDGDLMVGTATVLFAGDVLEEGADPSFEDAHPADWIQVLHRLAGLGGRYRLMVPGHGRTVTAGFAARMADVMAGALPTRSVSDSPYGPAAARSLAERLATLR
ncbi:MBL fold metallo-hydrolase [Specibacter sp. RAF43]|uniref:MBL fold metallo-hydrolase n=1 Tax=Specibacter sp. RAF43 TaxID=3233057 RepID=UPI003F950768